MGFVESMIKNHPEYERRRNVLAEMSVLKDNMKHRVPNEPWSTEEIEDAVNLAENGPIPGRPSVTRGAGDARTRSRAVPEDWSAIADNEILTQASKEMKELGIGWWDTVDNDKELQLTVEYIRNAGKDDDDDYVPEPEPEPEIADVPKELPQEIATAQDEINKFRDNRYDYDTGESVFYNRILGPRASGHPTKSWKELQESEIAQENLRDPKGGSYLDKYLLKNEDTFREALLAEIEQTMNA